jgi:hypothetical protein
LRSGGRLLCRGARTMSLDRPSRRSWHSPRQNATQAVSIREGHAQRYRNWRVPITSSLNLSARLGRCEKRSIAGCWNVIGRGGRWSRMLHRVSGRRWAVIAGRRTVIHGSRRTVIGPWARGIVIIGWRSAIVAWPWRGSEDTACNNKRRGGNYGSGTYDSTGNAKRKGEDKTIIVVSIIIPIGRRGRRRQSDERRDRSASGDKFQGSHERTSSQSRRTPSVVQLSTDDRRTLRGICR